MVYSLKDLAATLATATEKPYDRERDLTTFTREVEGSNVWVQNNGRTKGIWPVLPYRETEVNSIRQPLESIANMSLCPWWQYIMLQKIISSFMARYSGIGWAPLGPGLESKPGVLAMVCTSTVILCDPAARPWSVSRAITRPVVVPPIVVPPIEPVLVWPQNSVPVLLVAARRTVNQGYFTCQGFQPI